MFWPNWDVSQEFRLMLVNGFVDRFNQYRKLCITHRLLFVLMNLCLDGMVWVDTGSIWGSLFRFQLREILRKVYMFGSG